MNIRASHLIFSFMIAAAPGFSALSAARAAEDPEPPTLERDIRALLKDVGALAGQPEVEVGRLREMFTWYTARTPQARETDRLLMERIVQVSLPEAERALRDEQKIPVPFARALGTAWDYRDQMPPSYAAQILEPLLDLVAQSRTALDYVDSELHEGDDDLGIPRAQFFERLRRGEREYVLRRPDWPIGMHVANSIDVIIDDVIDSIDCDQPRSVDDGPKEMPERDEDAPSIWRGDEAKDLVEKLGERLLAMKFGVDLPYYPYYAANYVHDWTVTMDHLRDRASECEQPDWARKLDAQARALEKIEAEIRALPLPDGPFAEDSHAAELASDDLLRQQALKQIEASIDTLPKNASDALLRTIENEGDPLVRIQLYIYALRSDFVTSANVDLYLKKIFETGATLRTTSTEGYLYFLVETLTIPQLVTLERHATVQRQLAPALVDALNHLNAGWRWYFTYAPAEDNDGFRSSFAQKRLKGQVSLWMRDANTTFPLAGFYSDWAARDPVAAEQAFNEIPDASLRWVLRADRVEIATKAHYAKLRAEREAAASGRGMPPANLPKNAPSPKRSP